MRDMRERVISEPLPAVHSRYSAYRIDCERLRRVIGEPSGVCNPGLDRASPVGIFFIRFTFSGGSIFLRNLILVTPDSAATHKYPGICLFQQDQSEWRSYFHLCPEAEPGLGLLVFPACQSITARVGKQCMQAAVGVCTYAPPASVLS